MHLDFRTRGRVVVWCRRRWRAVRGVDGRAFCDGCGADITERLSPALVATLVSFPT